MPTIINSSSGATSVLSELAIRNNPSAVVLDSSRVRGGWRYVDTLADRDAIPDDARVQRIMRCYVQEDETAYELIEGISNEDWQEVPTYIPGSQADQFASVTNLNLLADQVNLSIKYASPGRYGAVGNGIADDTVPFLAMLAELSQGSNVQLLFPRNKTYKISQEVVLENMAINLNGCVLDFFTSGADRGMWVKSKTVLHNGTVRNNVTGASPSGERGAGILVGQYINTQGQSFKNIALHDLTIHTNQTGGGGIDLVILGNTSNVSVSRCIFPDNPYSIAAIIVHWGMHTTTPSEGTYHPHNIKFEDLEIGAFSYDHTEQACIATSACYNVSFDGVTIGGSSKRAILDFCGDFSFDFALDAALRSMGHRNVNYNDVVAFGTNRYGVDVVGKSTTTSLPYSVGSPYVTGRHSMGVTFTNVTIVGTDTLLSRGFNIGSCFDVKLVGCKTVKMYAGFVDAGYTSRIKLIDCESNGDLQYALWFEGVPTAGYESNDWQVIRPRVINSNTSNTANRAGIRVNNHRNMMILGAFIDAPNMTLGIRIEDSNTLGTSLIDNYIKAVKSGGVGYSIGLSTVYTTLRCFRNNGWDAAGVSLGVGGMNPMICETTSAGKRITYGAGPAAPTTGTWIAGDKLILSAPVAGGYEGFVCTIGGTPGTWKGYGLVQA